MYRTINRIDEFSAELCEINSLFQMVFTYIFDFSKADHCSEKEQERLNAYKLCDHYDMYRAVLSAAFDKTISLKEEIESLSSELTATIKTK